MTSDDSYPDSDDEDEAAIDRYEQRLLDQRLFLADLLREALPRLPRLSYISIPLDLLDGPSFALIISP